MKSKPPRNKLASANSPYLLAHASNPVDWYPWGEEAFAKAKSEIRPIFLSIGYNACHWCHVMERESFENDTIAEFLNQHFVSIKVDREERPDIDQIYMTAVQALTGSGGWPMTVFMTTDKKPFFAGTYFPPDTKYGRPGFLDLLTKIIQVYRDSPKDIESSAHEILTQISRGNNAPIPIRPIDRNVILSAAESFYTHFDQRHGGFGGAPKFPQPAVLSFLFRASHLTGDGRYAEAALFTLQKMAEGGIYDQIGGGFHRYSVDQLWLVPHFEKMLYDNAQLVIPYLEAYQVTGNRYYLSIVTGTLEYLQRKMTAPGGGFYSSQDADSEGEEGTYYTWTLREIRAILGPEAAMIEKHFGLTEAGNFDGRNILNVSPLAESVKAEVNLRNDEFTAKLAELRTKLLTERQKRVPPAIDDKILASWNGLAISAFAQAYLVTGIESYLNSARRAAGFILATMTDSDTLYHSWREGNLLKTELLEDYAYFTAGLIDLYQASLDETYLHRAGAFARRAVEQFSDGNQFYLSRSGDPDLIYRPRDLLDGATPSPGAVMILNLLRLAAITGDSHFEKEAAICLEGVSGLAARVPQGSATLLCAGYFALAKPIEMVVSSPSSDSGKIALYNREIFSRFIPNRVLVGSINGHRSELPLLEGRQNPLELTYYFCRNQTCRLPVTDIASLRAELDWLISNP